MNAPPHLLLVEDDPVSAGFLHTAASQLPTTITHAGSLAAALEACVHQRFDLLLIDANLPDGSGTVLLETLRASHIAPPALAHTADPTPAFRAALLAAGFREVLAKPITVAELHAALRRHLPGPPIAAPVWDDAQALTALGGQQEHVNALRGLFLKDLPAQWQRIDAASGCGDATTIRAELHRLAASCGFVGASGIAQAVHALRTDPLAPQALRALENAIEAALTAAD